MSTTLSTLKLGKDGDASLQGALGEITIAKYSGKITIKSKVSSLKIILDELIDMVLSHTHPTGTGPSGPPMPPESTKLPLLKSTKVGGSFE